MNSTSDKTCSRCGRGGCRSLDDETSNTEIDNIEGSTRAYLAKTFYACLCDNCLWQVRDLVRRADSLPMPATPDALQPGVHYSIENGLLVFSELYHVLKGYCCRNGCKNCAYGYTRKRPA